MKALRNTLLLLLATFALTSCGGGGGGSNSVFTPTGADSISISAAPPSIGTFSFTAITVTVQKNDGSSEDDGTQVSASLSPSTIGTVAPTQLPGGGATATNTLSGGKTTFYFNSSNQGGTATIAFSLPAGLHGNPNSASKSIGITVTPGNTQDPRLQLTPSTATLPVSPYTVGQEQDSTIGFPGNYLGSPYISEVTVTFRHSNGQLVNGSVTANVSVQPVGTLSYSTLVGAASTGSTDEFHTLLGSGQVTITAGVGTIFVHAGQQVGTGVLTVTAIDPDSGQTITSQLEITVSGGSSGLPTSVSITSAGTTVYVTNSGGAQSTIISALVTDGSNSFITAAAGVNNVQFQIVGPAGADARLAAVNAAGQQVSGTTVLTTTSNGVASVTFLAGTVQGPVQVRVTVDRGDNNVDNGIQDPVSTTATITVSDGKLDSITIESPDTDTVHPSGVSANVTEDPAGSGNYVLTLSAKGVDRQGGAVLPGTRFGWGDVDSPQVPNTSGNLRTWFQISGTAGDPKEGATLFTAADGRFTTAGGGAGPGDTLLVIGKVTEGAPAGNDDLESAVKITSVNSDTSLTVATPFNLNDRTGLSVDNHGVLPYIVGRAQFSSVVSPSFTDSTSSTLAGVAVTTLNYPASAIGKAVAVWAQGTGVDANSSPGRTDVITDIATFVLPGAAAGAILTASPDPLLGNSTQTVTVCYYDGNNHPISNYDISFSFALGGNGTGKVDGVAESGTLQNLTGANGCTTAQVQTSGLTTGSSATVTFSAGPANAGGASVTVGFVVDVGALQVSPCQFKGSASPQTVVIKTVDGGGAPLPNQTVAAACTVLSGAGTIAASAPLATDQTGVTYSIITVTPASDTALKGYCTFTSGSLIQSVGVNTGTCSTGSGGFSPTP